MEGGRPNALTATLPVMSEEFILKFEFSKQNK